MSSFNQHPCMPVSNPLHPMMYSLAGSLCVLNELRQLQNDQYPSRVIALFVFYLVFLSFSLFLSFCRMYTMSSANHKIIDNLCSANFYLSILCNLPILHKTGRVIITQIKQISSCVAWVCFSFLFCEICLFSYPVSPRQHKENFPFLGQRGPMLMLIGWH